MAKSMRELLSDLRAAVREVKATYRRKWPEPATYRKRSILNKRITKIHTTMFARAVFPDDVWSVARFNDATKFAYRVELHVKWPKTGDGKILRDAHKAVAYLSTPLRLYPENGMYVESTSYGINAVLKTNAAMRRFVARHKITLDPTSVIESHMRTISDANQWIQRIQKVTNKLNKLSSK